MGESEAISLPPSRKKRGNKLSNGATFCTNVHAEAARGIWKDKTAECWAAAAGRQPRIAKSWLRPNANVPPAARNALVRLLA